MRRALGGAVLLACSTGAVADFASLGNLAQGEFGRLSRDLAAAFSYKGVTPATSLGIAGFDIGVEVTATRMEHSALLGAAGAGSTSNLVIPKLHVHKGLWSGFDVGAFVGGASEIDATLYGAELRYAVLEDGLGMPAIGLRLSGSRVAGTGPLRLSTVAGDLVVSKKLTLLTPYAGGGIVRVASSAAGTPLAEESFNRSRYFAGLNVNLLTANFAFEAEKMGGNTSLSAKLGFRF